MVIHKRLNSVLRIAVVVVLVVALCMACIVPGYASVTAMSIIVPAVVAAMSSFGIGTLVSGMTSNQIADWVSNELSSWASSMSDSVENLISVSGISVTTLGSLKILPSVAYKIVLFVRWLANKYSVSAGGNNVVVSSLQFASNQPYRGNGSKFNLVSFNSNKYFQLFPRDSYNYYVFSYGYQSGTLNLCACVVGNVSAGFRFYRTDWQGADSFLNDTFNSSYNLRYAIYGLQCSSYNSYVPAYNSLSDGLYALSQYVRGNVPSISLSPDSVIEYPDYTGDDEEETPYIVDWGGTPGITVEQAASGIMEKIEDNELTSSGEIAINPDTVTWPDVVEPNAVNGLDDIFPFCIPFDVYHFFQSLIATPTAPHFEVPFVVPGLVNYTFVLDFAQFNTVAQIFRTMELLCFCIGLALATRRLIRG